MASPFEFYLTALNSDIDVALASISAEDATIDENENPKALAELYIDLAEIREVFKYATNAADLTDVSAEDMYFFVDADGFKNLTVQTEDCVNALSNIGTLLPADAQTLGNQICRAWVSGVQNPEAEPSSGRLQGVDFEKDPTGTLYTVDNKSMIKDLFRDMAYQLFGTQYGVDIIQNEMDICNNTFANTSALFSEGGNIWEALNDANEKSVAQVDASNIGQVIFRNIVEHKADRLQDICNNDYSTVSLNLNANETASPSGSDGNNTEMRMYRMPFASGDALIFHLNYNYHVDQQGVVESDGTATSTLNPRLYKVILRVL